jgi:hypothetical protein
MKNKFTPEYIQSLFTSPLDDYWDWEDVDKNRIVSVYDKKVVK